MCQRQVAAEVATLVACAATHPVQDADRHFQGSVVVCSAVRQLVAAPCDDVVAALLRRSAWRLFVPRTRTNIDKRGLSVAAPNVWNSLANNIHTPNCLSSL